MRFVGAITYDWHGQAKCVVAAPDVVIALREPWVTVGTRGRGTELVAWESIRTLSGWSPVASEDR